MHTHDLAKELRALAAKLDALTYEARGTVAAKLELERRNGYPQKRANKWDPPPLTIGAIKVALDAATARPSTSVELRTDVYDRRVKKSSFAFADLAEAAVRSTAPAPSGTPLSPHYAAVDGRRSIHDATPRYGKTPSNALAEAWTRAVRYVLGRIVPAYCYREVRAYAERALDGGEGGSIWRLEEKISGEVDRWLSTHAVLLCDVDASGQLVRVNGIDPAPFRPLLAAVEAGNPDPLGILKTT